MGEALSRIVKVEWVSQGNIDDICDPRDIGGTIAATTVGQVVRETDDHISLSRDWFDTGVVRGTTTIPKAAITSIQDLSVFVLDLTHKETPTERLVRAGYDDPGKSLDEKLGIVPQQDMQEAARASAEMEDALKCFAKLGFPISKKETSQSEKDDVADRLPLTLSEIKDSFLVIERIRYAIEKIAVVPPHSNIQTALSVLHRAEAVLSLVMQPQFNALPKKEQDEVTSYAYLHRGKSERYAQ